MPSLSAACVFTYTPTRTEPSDPTRAVASNVLVYTPALSAVSALLCRAYCCPLTHAWHATAVWSSPTNIVTLVARAKCGSKYTTTSAGAASLAKRFASADSDSTPLAHCDAHRVTSSLLFAFASQK